MKQKSDLKEFKKLKEKTTDYESFLKNKVVIAPEFGMDVSNLELTPKLFPHQKDIVHFCLKGGRRAIFASFGLGKTFMQLEIAKRFIWAFPSEVARAFFSFSSRRLDSCSHKMDFYFNRYSGHPR